MDMAAVRLVAIGRGRRRREPPPEPRRAVRARRARRQHRRRRPARRDGAALRGLRAARRARGPGSAVHRAHQRLPGRDARARADAADPLRLLDRPARRAGSRSRARRSRPAGRNDAVVLAYDASWLLAAVAAWALWRREARPLRGSAGDAGRRSGPPSATASRAPRRRSSPRRSSGPTSGCSPPSRTATTLDAYSAAARVSQVLLLFLTSLSLVFSPFVADLHARGERERLDELFKRSTRWALAATLPLLIVLFVAADDVLEAFSSSLRDRRGRAADPARRPGRERRHRRRRLHPHHDRLHGPRPRRQRARRRAARRPRGRPHRRRSGSRARRSPPRWASRR